MLSEIRDYCLTGLYLAFPGGGTPDAALPVLVGAAVEVTFAVGEGAAYRCEGRVAHLAPGGVGVFVAAMPEGALRALRRASGAGEAAEQVVLEAVPNPQQTDAMKQACTSLLRGFLDAVMQDVFQHAGERLVQAGHEELSFLERSRYEYGAQELALRRGRIEEEFFDAMREHIQHAAPPGEADCRAPGRDGLALVDEAEFEDWLNLSTVIKQIEADIGPQLDAFEQRYSRLIGLSIDRKNNPFGPEVTGRNFQGAIQALDFSNPMRTVLYRVLGSAISRHGPALYQQLNEILATLQPAAAAAAAPARQAERSRLGENLRAKPDLAEVADTLNTLYKQDRPDTPPSSEGGEYSLDRILSTLNQSGRNASGVVSSQRRLDGAAFGKTPSAGVLQAVERLQREARQLDRRGFTSTTGPADETLAPASLNELLSALDGLPLSSPVTVVGSTQSSLADQIQSGITAGAPRRLAHAHRRILETTSGLFERAREDLTPSSDVEALVKRLERPLLKLALQDALFPTSPDHPARQVLNLIEQYAVAADDKGRFFDPKLQRFLYLLVDRVCSRADEDPGIFEMVRDSLDKVLQPILQTRRTRVARLQEASEGRERIRTARGRVNSALEALLGGREVPAMLLRLLDAGWRQHLVLLEIREGEGGEAWEAALAVLDRLRARSAAHVHGDADEDVQVLLATIERGLSTVNVDAGLVAAFVDELGDWLRSETLIPATILMPPGSRVSPMGPSDAERQFAGRLRVGEWWEFKADGSRVPMQLIWVSQPLATCAFANRSATQKQDLTLAELSRQIRNGEARPTKDFDLPLIERSEQSLFDETYRQLVKHALHDPVTGLLNRKGFMQRLDRIALPDDADQAHAVGIIEFDQFRMIYNTCGVEAAEGLARALAQEVQTLIGTDAVIAAFRDDTLALLLPNCKRVEKCSAIDKLLGQVKDYPFQHEQHRYSIGFNIGITEYVPDRFSAVEAIRRADSACIAAKALGRNRIQIYEQASPRVQSQESLMDWAGRIDAFLEGRGLHLRCQQVRPIGADALLLPYYEILLGIESDAGVDINPTHFIPAVERLQRAHEVDIWVMRNVFEWIQANPSGFAAVGGFAINLSATSLSNPDVMRYLQKVLPDGNFPTTKIIFEITETAAIESYGAAQDFIREVRRYGCKFSLDDFGSGFTSYAHLKNLRTDTLKIDGSFVKDMLQNPGDYAMVKSMNDIGHSLGLRTVAEYVESPAILDALMEIGVDYAQGYAIHRPCRLDELMTVHAV